MSGTPDSRPVKCKLCGGLVHRHFDLQLNWSAHFFKPPHSKCVSPGPYCIVISTDDPGLDLEVSHLIGQFAEVVKKVVQPPNKNDGRHQVAYQFQKFKCINIILKHEEVICSKVENLNIFYVRNRKAALDLLGEVDDKLEKNTPSSESKSGQKNPVKKTSPSETTTPVTKKAGLAPKTIAGDKSSELMQAMKKGTTFVEQLSIFQTTIQSSQKQFRAAIEIILLELNNAFSKQWSMHIKKIHCFGSSITGLDYSGSDLDLHFETKSQMNLGEEKHFMKNIKLALYRSKRFQDIILISASYPIVKCLHKNTGISCDISVRNRLSIHNTNLLCYYIGLDEKIKTLMLLVKFWADCNGLKKVNLFSSYSLSMMVIFFLQQMYDIPTVETLQGNLVNIQGGWNAAFKPVENYSNVNLRQVNILQLFAEFMRFYCAFDFYDYVICPFMGQPIRKVHFIAPFELPDVYSRYKNLATKDQKLQIKISCGVCIQDPFEHSRNVTSSISIGHLSKFIALCRATLNMIAKGCPLSPLLCLSMTSNECIFELLKPPNLNLLDDKEWCDTMRDVTKTRILEGIFQFCVDNSNVKLPDSFNILGHIVWNCQIVHDVLPPHRFAVAKKLSAGDFSDDIEREVAISAELLKEKQAMHGSLIHVTIVFGKNPCKLKFTLKGPAKVKNLVYFGHIIELLLKKWAWTVPSDVDPVIPKELESATSGPKPQEEVSNSNGSVKTEKTKMDLPSTEAPNLEIQVGKFESKSLVLETKERAQPEVETTEEIMGDPSDAVLNVIGGDGNSGSGDKVTLKQESPAEESDKVAKSTKSVDDEEDVPADFFDDFANDDFMEGLDIVDAWDEDSPGKPTRDDDETPTRDNGKHKTVAISPIIMDGRPQYTKRSTHSKTPGRNDRSCHSGSGSDKRHHKVKNSHEPVKRDSKTNSPSRDSKKRSRSRSFEKTRRDPEKTRRDISRDKIKCAKDKEFKIVNDKLRIVETGLVPPGTEMEVDTSTVANAAAAANRSEREKKHTRRSASRERDPRKSLPRHGKPSPASHGTRSPIRRRTPPRRSRSRSPYRPRLRPAYRNRRRSASGSPKNHSDREMWLRKRSRTRSPDNRSKMRKYDEEQKKKKSFLEEIRDKLNETTRPVVVPMQHQYPYQGPPHPVPAPVPAPGQFYRPPMVQGNNAPQYDQSFFVGDGFSLNQPSPVRPVIHPLYTALPPVVPSFPPQPSSTSSLKVVQPPPVAKVTKEAAPPPTPPPVVAAAAETAVAATAAKKDVDKLFVEKKISLSDFLTITAKPEVLNRCQRALRMIGEDENRFSGKLRIKPSTKRINDKPDQIFLSPLRKIPVVRFRFTSPTKRPLEETNCFGGRLDKILRAVGLLQNTIQVDDDVAESSSNQDELVLKNSLILSRGKVEDGGSCPECKKRKLTVHSETGTQCVVPQSVSVACQVNEDDLAPFKPKNESLALLTPAQLLGRATDKEREKESSAKPVPQSPSKSGKVEEKSPVVQIPVTAAAAPGKSPAAKPKISPNGNKNNKPPFAKKKKPSMNFQPPPPRGPPPFIRQDYYEGPFMYRDGPFYSNQMGPSHFQPDYRDMYGGPSHRYGPRY